MSIVEETFGDDSQDFPVKVVESNRMRVDEPDPVAVPTRCC